MAIAPIQPAGSSRLITPARALTLLSLLLIVRSVWYVLRYYTPQAFFDFWFWVSDFQLWEDGRFTLHDLLKPHYGQHRIATTRVLLLLDSLFFHMNGLSVVLVNLALLAGVGLLIWRLMRLDGVARTGWDLPGVFWVALALSVCQVENLIYPFQVQFALTCLFGVGAASLLAAATRPEASRQRSAWLAAGAGGFGILAAFSMASGVLVAPGMLVLLALRRARAPVWAVFVPISAAGVAAFFHHYPHSPHPPLLDAHLAAERVIYIGNFLASAMTGFPAMAATTGLLALLLFLVVAAGLVRRFVFRDVLVPEGDAALIGVGVFVALCGPAATMTGRLLMGAEVALVSRYATMSLLFAAILFGLYARWGARTGPGWARQWGLPGAAGAVLLVVNAPVYDLIGAGLNGVVTADSQLLRNNVGIAGPVPVIFGGTVDDVRGQIRFLHERRLNIFSDGEAPPPALLAALHGDLAHLPACKGSVDDAYAIDGSAFLVRGWLAGSDAGRTMPWVGVLDADGHVIGIARSLGERPDVQAALGMAQPAHGFETGFRLQAPASFSGAPVRMRFAGLDPDAPRPACLLAGAVTPGPWLFPLAGALRDVAPATSTAPGVTPSTGGFALWHGGGFAAPGVADAPPGALFAGGPVWRAAEGASGTIRFSVTPQAARDLAIPFAVAGGAHGSHVTVRFSDGSVIDSPIPWIWDRVGWRAAVVPASMLAAHGGAVVVELQSDGSRPLFAALPLLATLAANWARLF